MIPNTDPDPYCANVLADSIASGVRLTTLVIKFPRFVLAEFNTHRTMSRSSASSRAIPVEKRIAEVRANPFVPLSFGKNKRGMQSTEEIEDQEKARVAWRQAAIHACFHAENVAAMGVHKQFANRLIEPFAFHTVICSATEWANYFALRCSEFAQPEIRIVSEAMRDAMDASTPVELAPGEWHLPLIDDGDRAEVADPVLLARVSAARCARVSYLTHGGERSIEADLELYDRLVGPGHMAPLEMAAMVGEPFDQEGYARMHKCSTGNETVGFSGPFIGNFRAPWIQLRKTIPGEAVHVKDPA